MATSAAQVGGMHALPGSHAGNRRQGAHQSDRSIDTFSLGGLSAQPQVFVSGEGSSQIGQEAR